MNAIEDLTPKRRRKPGVRALRRLRILTRMREGWSYDDIARAEKITLKRLRLAIATIIAKRVIDDDVDHARIQLTRLEAAMLAAGAAIAEGDVTAIGPMIRVLDRVDRYRTVAAAHHLEGEAMRARLLAKLNRAAEALAEDRQERERASRFAEALADSSIGEEEGYKSEDAIFFLNSVTKP